MPLFFIYLFTSFFFANVGFDLKFETVALEGYPFLGKRVMGRISPTDKKWLIRPKSPALIGMGWASRINLLNLMGLFSWFRPINMEGQIFNVLILAEELGLKPKY